MTKALILLSVFFVSLSLHALEVVKPVFKKDIVLKIVRAIPDGFETYSLTNDNGREMTLVCAKNKFYGNNSQAFIEYRNFYNLNAGNFIIDHNSVCKDMGKFIEATHFGIDEQRPFIISLSTKLMKVQKIVYPRIDPHADSGDERDLYPKKEIRDFVKPEILLH